MSGAPTATSVRDFKADGSTLDNGDRSDYNGEGGTGFTGPNVPICRDAVTASGVDKGYFDKDDVESVLLEHSRKSWWNLFTVCKRIFRSHRFRNVQAEVLYQRYFLRMNQNNMASLLSILIVISISMIIVNHIVFPAATPPSSLNLTLPSVNVSDDVYHLNSGEIVQGATLGVFAILYLVLVTLMTRAFLNEVYLIIFSYIILASFFGIEVLVVLHSEDPKSAAAGVWCTMFFIYMTYTLLALHIQECAISGILLAVTQIACAAGLNYDDPYLGKQVTKTQTKKCLWPFFLLGGLPRIFGSL